MSKRKPRLLIIGHGRHGKDTVAEMIQEKMGLKFTSSSVFVAEEIIWPLWGKDRYESFEAMFEDRVNCRKIWFNLIEAYNTPDKTKTAQTMIDRGYDMYVGMRNPEELKASVEAGIFDYIIWVDASHRLPKEPADSMGLNETMADIFIDNNGPDWALEEVVGMLQKRLHKEGFEVQMPREITSEEQKFTIVKGLEETSPELAERTSWEAMPEGAEKVLDHGFFRLDTVMGSDKAICEAARMSYGRGTKKVNKDEGLINYLIHNYHTSPLEMAEVKVHMRLPIFVMRQLVRHRTANLNEYSGRYSEMVRLFYVPEIDQIKDQDTVNKQGSANPLPHDEAVACQQIISRCSNSAFDDYEDLLDRKVSRETARIILPLNTYTEVVWKIDISNLLKFLYLRDDPHAQYEIRVYARHLARVVESHFPLVYAAYLRQRNRISLTQEQILALIKGGDVSGLGRGEAKVVQDLIGSHAA